MCDLPDPSQTDRRARLHHPFILSSLLPVTCHRFDAAHSILCGRVDIGLIFSTCADAVRRSLAQRERVTFGAAGTCVHAAQSRSRGAEQLPFMAIPGHTYEGSGAALKAGGRQPDLGIKFVWPHLELTLSAVFACACGDIASGAPEGYKSQRRPAPWRTRCPAAARRI